VPAPHPVARRKPPRFTGHGLTRAATPDLG
jgi:hypothetical protein